MSLGRESKHKCSRVSLILHRGNKHTRFLSLSGNDNPSLYNEVVSDGKNLHNYLNNNNRVGVKFSPAKTMEASTSNSNANDVLPSTMENEHVENLDEMVMDITHSTQVSHLEINN